MAKGREAKTWPEQYRTLRAMWAQDPVTYARKRLGLNPTWQQADIMRAMAPEGAKTSARSGHGIGKTGAVAAVIWWFLETRDYPKIPCTAPTSHQLRDVLWAELSKWRRNSDRLWAARGLPMEYSLGNLFQITKERVYTPDARDEWYAVARTSGRDNPDALQGFHATSLQVSEDGTEIVEEEDDGGQILFVLEEASGIFEQVFEVAEGALSSAGARMLMVGNPTSNAGTFAASHKQDRAHYTTLHFRTSDSPLAAPDYRDRLAAKYGPESNVVRVRADGDFPKQDDDVLIAVTLTEAALERPVREVYPQTPTKLGIDVARFGDDRTVFVCRTGANVDRIAVHGKLDTMETVGWARHYAAAWGVDVIKPEINGFPGVTDRLAEAQHLPVRGVDVTRAAPPRAHDEDMQGRTMRDFLWVEGERYLREEEPSFARARQHNEEAAQDLAGELSTVKYSFDSDGRVQIESKRDRKEKRKLSSPDLADAFLCTLAPDNEGGAPVASAGTREF